MKIVFNFFFIALSLTAAVNCQTCHNVTQYGPCSVNTACGCLYLSSAVNTGICGLLSLTCSSLVECDTRNNACYEPAHICVNHPRCSNKPLCYPLSMTAQQLCAPIPSTTEITLAKSNDSICENARWHQNGITVAGGNGAGLGLHQLTYPIGFFLDHNGSVYIVDGSNRIVKWIRGTSCGIAIVDNYQASSNNDLIKKIRSVVITKNETMFICDQDNRQVQRWFKNDYSGQSVVTNIPCSGLALDDEESLYVSHDRGDRITKWPGGKIVAGGNGLGNSLKQISSDGYFFVDQDKSVIVADIYNHRVMKWPVDNTEGILIAGGNGHGSGLKQLNTPIASIMDQMGRIYVLDNNNNRVVRWSQNATSGTVIVGGKGNGDGKDQLSGPLDLQFDHYGNLYVLDTNNHRVQVFPIDKSSCP
ncbi:unnamed protein product [Adineta steineri]|uniref:NHL repeat containing protein-like protein n=1 Tax=Adineta steineri TaxID=433720 RepID=A0A813UY75_9BILA|nr:unnamed protein product [Adineta steineri]